MHFLLTYLRFHSDKVRLFGLAVVLVLLVALLVMLRPAAGGLTPLGDVGAPPAASGNATAPYAAVAPPAVRPGMYDLQADPRSRDAAAAAAQPDPEHQDAVLDALNCARARQNLAALPLDSDLSARAADLGRLLAAHPDTSLAELAAAEHYALVVVTPLSFAGAADEADPAVQQPAAPSGPCAVGGFDTAQLDLADATAAFGIAVFPDPQGAEEWDVMSAVILAR
ncbi:MAG TPA: hypothetical protein VNL77_13920 [Roseiflexaceae bacterium]|nr:hypothetical protein [Roseiflexaceae bacterium]